MITRPTNSKTEITPPSGSQVEALKLRYDIAKQIVVSSSVIGAAFAGFHTTLIEKDVTPSFTSQHGWFSALVFLYYGFLVLLGYIWMEYLVEVINGTAIHREKINRWITWFYVLLFGAAGVALFFWGLTYFESVDENKPSPVLHK